MTVAKLVGVTPAWAAQIVHRWNQHGPNGHIDHRRNNGSDPPLSTRQHQHLVAMLGNNAPHGGLWSGPKVAAYVKKRWKIRINPATGWKWLRKLGFTLQVPRPSHPNSATLVERRGWKKSPERPGADPP